MDRADKRMQDVDKQAERIIDAMFDGKTKIESEKMLQTMGALAKVMGVTIATVVRDDPGRLDFTLNMMMEGTKIAAKTQLRLFELMGPDLKSKSGKPSKWEIN